MNNQIRPVGEYNEKFNSYLPYSLSHAVVYQSSGLVKHIQKRHPDCLEFVSLIPTIIESPDYIGVNPHEEGVSFELVKVLAENLQVGIKLDTKEEYLYVATLHPITEAKLKHGIANGRLKKFDK